LPQSKPFFYGGQAIIEGVMIRGRRTISLAVRRPDGGISTHSEGIGGVYQSKWRSVPFVRGIIVLAETLVMGTRALMFSAKESIGVETEKGTETLGSGAIWATMGVAFAFSIGLFFVIPLLITHSVDSHIKSSILSNLLEGVMRLGILIGYLSLLGLLKDARRLFMYHGAEHMTIKAYEAKQELSVTNIRQHSTAHPRCGTAFLFIVILVSVLVFAFLGRPDFYIRFIERIALVPVVAAVSYEVIRLNGAHSGNIIFRMFAAPSMWLQKLTTRQPDDSQIEVAVKAMEGALKSDVSNETQTQA